jgi:competence protein ComEC
MARRLLTCLAAAAVLVIFIGPPAGHGQSMSAGTTQISYIDVGQGDAALLQDPGGTDILIDGGPAAAGPAVVSYIRSHTDHSLEEVIVTHADADHSGGIVTLLKASDISIGTIYYNGYPGDTITWNNLVSLANSRSIPMVAAQFPAEFTWGQMKIYILNPAAGLANPEQNDASVVARVDFVSNRFLFTGDISSTIEATVVARQTPLASDVLKVAHHGSAYSSSANFLAAVHPKEGVISVGANNSYGHPAPAVLARLAAAGVEVWRTDQQGTLLITSDGSTVTFPVSGSNGFAVYLPVVMSP